MDVITMQSLEDLARKSQGSAVVQPDGLMLRQTNTHHWGGSQDFSFESNQQQLSNVLQKEPDCHFSFQ